MQRFIFLDHPNDIIIRAYGRNQKELFENAAIGLMSYLYPKYVDIYDHEAKTHIEVKAVGQKELLIDFLSEISALANEREICYNQFQFSEINDKKVSGYMYGKRFRKKENVSGIKYQGLKLKESTEGLEAEFRLDVKRN